MGLSLLFGFKGHLTRLGIYCQLINVLVPEMVTQLPCVVPSRSRVCTIPGIPCSVSAPPAIKQLPTHKWPLLMFRGARGGRRAHSHQSQGLIPVPRMSLLLSASFLSHLGPSSRPASSSQLCHPFHKTAASLTLSLSSAMTQHPVFPKWGLIQMEKKNTTG